MKFTFDGYGINFADGRLKGERFATLMQPGRILSEEGRKICGTLMAAAPELLDALRDTLAQAKWYAPRNPDELGGQFACDVIAKARAAIARATHP